MGERPRKTTKVVEMATKLRDLEAELASLTARQVELEAERDELQTRVWSIEDEVIGPYNEALEKRVAEAEAALGEVERAIAWACGEGDSHFLSEAERKERGLPIYWWRSELRRRAALSAPDQEGKDG